VLLVKPLRWTRGRAVFRFDIARLWAKPQFTTRPTNVLRLRGATTDASHCSRRWRPEGTRCRAPQATEEQAVIGAYAFQESVSSVECERSNIGRSASVSICLTIALISTSGSSISYSPHCVNRFVLYGYDFQFSSH